jgi:hypothetical protein
LFPQPDGEKNEASSQQAAALPQPAAGPIDASFGFRTPPKTNTLSGQSHGPGSLQTRCFATFPRPGTPFPGLGSDPRPGSNFNRTPIPVKQPPGARVRLPTGKAGKLEVTPESNKEEDSEDEEVQDGAGEDQKSA